MKKQLSVLLILLLGLTYYTYGQATDATPAFGVKWTGFVKTDYMFDTRQTINSREGHFMILPAAEKLVNGEDVNDQTNFNILSIQTRLKAGITGPDFFGMKTSGAIEADFFGNSGTGLDDVNGFRLRHAFVQLSNDKVEILMGQFWHPMFITSVFPDVYSFNTGVPFAPFSRNPQLRLTTKGKVRFMGALFTERDFQTRGASVSQAGIPQLHAQLQFGSVANSLGGFGVNFKSARPALGLDNVTSTSFVGYFRTQLGKTTWKAEAIYGQNMSDILQISGFGTANGDYVNNDTFTAWTEFNADFSETMEWGVFGGYSKNGGYGEAITYSNGFLGNNVESAFRVSPRIGWKSGKMKIGIEGEFTSAQYGTIDTDGSMRTTGIDPVGNFRLLTTAIYNF